jgi:hypothetical protein
VDPGGAASGHESHGCFAEEDLAFVTAVVVQMRKEGMQDHVLEKFGR